MGGDLRISGNDALTNLDGLSRLTSVVGYATIGNNALTHLNGLSSLSSVGTGWQEGGLSIRENGLLTNLSGLSNLTYVAGTTFIVFNPSLCQSQVEAWASTCAGCGMMNIGNNNDGC